MRAKIQKKIDRENFLQYIAPQDLKSFGLIPEIIGRLPVLTYLEPLDRAALRNILTEPKKCYYPAIYQTVRIGWDYTQIRRRCL